MIWVPVIAGPIQRRYPAAAKLVEIVYRCENKMILLQDIHERKAEREIELHGMRWSAYKWRYTDSWPDDWQYVNE